MGRRRRSYCQDHDHPRLARPVSRRQVRRELERLYRQAGFEGPLDLHWTNELEDTHRHNSRRYAQVAPWEDPPRFELAPQTVYLPARNRRALLAHEVGHALDPHGGEDDADAAAECYTGVRVGYDKRWPGKGLQVAMNPSAHEMVREHFRRWRATGDQSDYDAFVQARRRAGLAPEPESWPINHAVIEARTTKRKRMKTDEAIRVIETWLRRRGWQPDTRATLNVWISRSAKQRMQFKRNHVLFEIGGRGNWTKNYDIHRYGDALGIIDFAHRILRRSKENLDNPYAKNPSEPQFWLVCAWCDEVLKEGDPGAPVSHGICEECKAAFLAEDGFEQNPFPIVPIYPYPAPFYPLMPLPPGTLVNPSPDARLRDLERRWKETGDAAAHGALLRELMRTGGVDPAKLWLLARAGQPEREAIQAAFGEAVPLAVDWPVALGGCTTPTRFQLLISHDLEGEHDRGEPIPASRLKTRFEAWAILLETARRVMLAQEVEPNRWIKERYGNWIEPEAIRKLKTQSHLGHPAPHAGDFFYASANVGNALRDLAEVLHSIGVFAIRVEVPERWVQEALDSAHIGVLPDDDPGMWAEYSRDYLEGVLLDRQGALGLPWQADQATVDFDRGRTADGTLIALMYPNERATEELFCQMLSAALLAWLRDDPPPPVMKRATFPR